MYPTALFFRKYLLVGSCLLFVTPIFAQVDTTEILARLCQGYLAEERQTIADTSYTPDAAGEIFSPLMAEYVRKRFLYQYVIGRSMIMHPDRKAIPFFEKKQMGCRLTFPGATDVFADIAPTERGLRVAGINGEIIGESQIRDI